MEILETIRKRAADVNARIVLPESLEERTLRAVEIIKREGIARPILLGNAEQIRQQAKSFRVDLDPQVVIIDPQRSDKTTDFATELFNLRKAKGMTYEQARQNVQTGLYFGAMMVRRGECEGMVAGAINTTADVLRSAIHCVGTAQGIKTVSSIFLMVLPDGRAVTYGDCAVVPYPNPPQLADIAVASAKTHFQLTGETPRVALLSFSTRGSAQHEAVTKVTDTLKILREREPQLDVDGELQFDAAYVEAIGKRKAPGSTVAGRANVFIFPNLDAGNISYKITERIGHAQAVGPVIQGVAKPINDLSRGCSTEDIVNVVAICCLRSRG